MTVSAVQCVVEVYPYEGQPIQLQAPFLRAVTVSRNLRQTAGGFEMSLMPGGPGGINSSPTWSELLTPMSLVIIGMRRDTYTQIVMIGVVIASQDGQAFSTGHGVQRSTIISGSDFGYYFDTFNYYTLGALASAGAVIGEGTSLNAPFYRSDNNAQGVPGTLATAYNHGTPDQLAVRFYNQAMVGPGGILSHTTVPYQNNAKLKLRDVIGVFGEPYSPNIVIPSATTLITTEGNWTAKMLTMFTFPFYEFFVTTAPLGHYGVKIQDKTVNANDVQGPGYPFKMKSMPDALPSSPVLVGRANPLPDFKVTIKEGNLGFSFDGLDMARWKALPRKDAGTSSFISSRVGWSVDEVRNFYQLNPVAMRNILFGSAANASNWGFATAGAIDPYSINRYGYRPETTATNYFYDVNGVTQADTTYDAPQTAATLLARVCSYHEPTAFMLRGEVTMNLRPDIMIGGVFSYSPFKGQLPYDFYIEGVSHSFNFDGRQATTGLNLSRGLPSAVYQDTGLGGKLMALHLGNAQRAGNSFTIGLPKGSGYPLTSFGLGTDLLKLLGSVAPGFGAPQSNPGS